MLGVSVLSPVVSSKVDIQIERVGLSTTAGIPVESSPFAFVKMQRMTKTAIAADLDSRLHVVEAKMAAMMK